MHTFLLIATLSADALQALGLFLSFIGIISMSAQGKPLPKLLTSQTLYILAVLLLLNLAVFAQ